MISEINSLSVLSRFLQCEQFNFKLLSKSQTQTETLQSLKEHNVCRRGNEVIPACSRLEKVTPLHVSPFHSKIWNEMFQSMNSKIFYFSASPSFSAFFLEDVTFCPNFLLYFKISPRSFPFFEIRMF